MLWKLLKIRLRIIKNSFLKGSTRHKIAIVIAAIISLSFVAVSYIISLGISEGLKLGNLMDFYEVILVIAATAAFIMLLFLTVTVAISTFYTTSDISFLMAMPINVRTVFTAKFIEIYLVNVGTAFIFGYPALIAFGNVTGASLLYYLMALLAVLFLALLPTGLGVILVVFLMRVIPAYRAKEIMGALGGLLGIAIWSANQLLRPSPNGGTGPMVGKEKQIMDALSIVKGFWANLLPTTWVARSITNFAHGDLQGGLISMAYLAVVAVLVLIVALLLVEKLFYYGWSRSNEVKPIKKKARIDKSKGLRLNILPVTVRAIVLKDFRLITRNLQELVQMLFPLIIIIIISLQINSGTRGALPKELSLAKYLLLGMILFFIGTFNMRLSLGAFGRERDNIWLILSSGAKPVDILWGKFLVAYVPSMIITLLEMLAMALFGSLDIETIVVFLFIILIASAAYTVSGLFLGVLYPRFDGKNPQQVFTAFGGIINSIINLFLTGVFIGIYALIQLLKYIGIGNLLVDLVSIIILGAVVSAFVLGMINLSDRRLGKMEL